MRVAFVVSHPPLYLKDPHIPLTLHLPIQETWPSDHLLVSCITHCCERQSLSINTAVSCSGVHQVLPSCYKYFRTDVKRSYDTRLKDARLKLSAHAYNEAHVESLSCAGGGSMRCVTI
jgi:hypothetical protein